MLRHDLISDIETIDLAKLTTKQSDAIGYALSIIRSIAPSDFQRGSDEIACCGGGCCESTGQTMGGPC